MFFKPPLMESPSPLRRHLSGRSVGESLSRFSYKDYRFQVFRFHVFVPGPVLAARVAVFSRQQPREPRAEAFRSGEGWQVEHPRLGARLLADPNAAGAGAAAPGSHLGDAGEGNRDGGWRGSCSTPRASSRLSPNRFARESAKGFLPCTTSPSRRTCRPSLSSERRGSVAP